MDLPVAWYIEDYWPRRVLTQTAKTRGGILEVPAYRQDYFSVPEKISIFQKQGSQGIAEKYARDCRKVRKGCRNVAGGRITLDGDWERSSEEER